MRFDVFELRIDPASYSADPARQRYLPVEIWINGKLLLDDVRVIETQYVNEENRQNAEGEQADSDGSPYFHLPTSCVLLPCRNLLDNPRRHGFVLDSEDTRNRKATIFGCNCGIIECWFLQVLVTISEEAVTWSDFGQFHRDWTYSLGPFVFERRQYESELAKQPSELVYDLPIRRATHQ